jgi:hypothetical protein
MKKMKKILQSTIYILICILVLSSCGSKSEKGKWSKDDMKKCIEESVAEINKDADAKEGMKLLNVNIEEAADCACKKAEEIYESFEEADKELEKMSEEEAAKLIADCIGLGDVNSAEGGWTDEAKQLFLTGCNEEPGFEDFCECGLSKIMEKYTFFELENVSEEEFGFILEECGSFLE